MKALIQAEIHLSVHWVCNHIRNESALNKLNLLWVTGWVTDCLKIASQKELEITTKPNLTATLVRNLLPARKLT